MDIPHGRLHRIVPHEASHAVVAATLADPSLRADASVLLDRLYRETCAGLHAHRDALERMVAQLLAERRLDGAELSGPRDGAGLPGQPA